MGARLAGVAWPALEPETRLAHLIADVRRCLGVIPVEEGRPGIRAFQREFWMVLSDKVVAVPAPADPTGEALNLRGSLRGRTVPGGADPGLSLLACASVLPGQGLYLGRGNCPAGHGKEKVYGSIP